MTHAHQATDIVGVILAGGLSRRMGGGDKALRSLGGQAIMEHVIGRLRPQVGKLIINANGDTVRFHAFGLVVVSDSIPDFAGPLAGVLAGMRWAEEHAPNARWIVTVAADTPFFPLDLVPRLTAAAGVSGDAIVLARSAAGLHPVFGLWPVHLANDLDAALSSGTRKVAEWAIGHGAIVADFEPLIVDGGVVDPFFNANRPEDLREAEFILERMRS